MRLSGDEFDARKVLDKHFACSAQIRRYSRERNSVPGALEKLERACLKQIALAPEAAAAFRMEWADRPLPSHAGYEQLVRIRAKQKNWVEYKRLCEEAKGRGWNGHWDAHIAAIPKYAGLRPTAQPRATGTTGAFPATTGEHSAARTKRVHSASAAPVEDGVTAEACGHAGPSGAGSQPADARISTDRLVRSMTPASADITDIPDLERQVRDTDTVEARMQALCTLGSIPSAGAVEALLKIRREELAMPSGLLETVNEFLTFRTCLHCQDEFAVESIHGAYARYGLGELGVCMSCLEKALQGPGNRTASEEGALAYLRDFADLTGTLPTQDFTQPLSALSHVEEGDVVALLEVLERRPSTDRIIELFDSWLNALVQAGVLADGTRPTARGIHTLAQDGHVCLSLGEKVIDDWLSSRGISHEREPRYPEGNFRADWQVGAVLIEYFGLAGNPDYDAKTEVKKRICSAHDITLVALYPKDLASRDGLDKRLSVLL